MLQDVINDRMEQASVTMHEYFVSKTREVTGLGEVELTEEEVGAILESATEEELDEAVRAGYVSTKGEERRKDSYEPWDDEEKADDKEKVIARPRSQIERNQLARTIKNNRANNRDANNQHRTNPAQRAGARSAVGKSELWTGRSYGAAKDTHAKWSGGNAARDAGKNAD